MSDDSEWTLLAIKKETQFKLWHLQADFCEFTEMGDDYTINYLIDTYTREYD